MRCWAIPLPPDFNVGKSRNNLSNVEIGGAGFFGALQAQWASSLQNLDQKLLKFFEKLFKNVRKFSENFPKIFRKFLKKKLKTEKVSEKVNEKVNEKVKEHKTNSGVYYTVDTI